jgi:hypothetical protein
VARGRVFAHAAAEIKTVRPPRADGTIEIADGFLQGKMLLLPETIAILKSFREVAANLDEL